MNTSGSRSFYTSVAVSRDGSTLLITDIYAIHTYRVADGAYLGSVCNFGAGPPQFRRPSQVSVASDGFIFVAEARNHRIQILTPQYAFHAYVCLKAVPAGVCADSDVIVVSERDLHRISVFRRGDGTLMRRFGSLGDGCRQLRDPRGLSWMAKPHEFGVADAGNHRVCIFTTSGEFVRHIGVGNLIAPYGLACSAANEILVADIVDRCVKIFSASGDNIQTVGTDVFTGVTVHGGTLFGMVNSKGKCMVFR